MSASRADILAALEDITVSLGTDGYELKVQAFEDGNLRLSVDAGAGACEECLVPKAVMEAAIRRSLGGRFGISRIHLSYPVEPE